MDTNSSSDQAMQIYYGSFVWIWVAPILLPTILAFILTKWLTGRLVFFILLPATYVLSVLLFIPYELSPSTLNPLLLLNSPGYLVPIIITISIAYIAAGLLGKFTSEPNTSQNHFMLLTSRFY